MTPRRKIDATGERPLRAKKTKEGADEASSAPAQRMTIEPDTRFPLEAAGTFEEEPWTPKKRGDVDLSGPPSYLLRSRKTPPPEVEDILEEPEPEHSQSRQHLLKPVVRTGLYRKLGIGFAGVAVLMLLLVAYVAYAHATVVVYPKGVEVKTDRTVNVSAKPVADDDIPGEVQEVIVSGEKSFAPGQAVQSATTPPVTAPAPISDTSAVYTGTVTIYNKTANAVTLVEKTRLLTKDDVLFRLSKRVLVAAGGSAKGDVYADKAGSSGGIGPSTFTIPGLPVALQSSIYAESDAAMAANGVPAPVVATTVPSAEKNLVTAEELDAAEKSLREDLTAQAKTQLAKKITGTWSDTAYLVETMNRFVNVVDGQATNQVIIRLTIRVRSVSFDQEKAEVLANADLKRGLTSDRQLVESSIEVADVIVDHADPKTASAAVRLTVKGNSNVSLNSPLFDANKLKGLDLAAVQTYFESIEGVERVDVRFRPFWLKRMPDLADHITFQVGK